MGARPGVESLARKPQGFGGLDHVGALAVDHFLCLDEIGDRSLHVEFDAAGAIVIVDHGLLQRGARGLRRADRG